ncbi:MAG: hypothetical protein NZ528_07655 [Caldilineales bacterium]|nr:hypothetical protein [Caldilineales bacterium]MDW8316755.1 hypothetical protein [Anaerolineae bacterium]
MQSTHRLLRLLLLLALLLTLAAPAHAQRPGPAAQPLGVAPAGQAKEEACAALSAQEEAELAKLAELKAAGQLSGANYQRFLKLSARADCAAEVAAPEAISAVSTYSFSQFAGTYIPITGGTVHGTGTGVDDNNYNAVNIGFTFNYDGVAYTQVGINANGFVRMGGTSFSGSCNYTPINSTDTTNCKNLVSALGMDLQGNTGGELRSQTLGTAPNRVFVVQWKDFRFYGQTGESFNFQIRLYETTDVVEFVYGAFTKNATARSPQVGLKGATTADYNNRTGTNWAASTAGTSNSATMTLSTSSLPASGQTYQWTPPSPLDPPGCAINPSPGNGAIEVWWDADLTWMPGPGGTPTSYDVYFGTSPTPPFVVNQAGTTYDPGTMPYGTTHYWQIVPKNSNGSATGCPVWSFTTFAPVTPTYSQSFDGTVTGWTIENTNLDSYVWGLQSTYRRGTTGGAAGIRWNTSAPMDDWLFTPPLQLTGGTTYAVRFFYRAGSTSWTEKMEVKWGNANNSAAMTSPAIFNDANINFTTMKEAIATFTPSTSGVYFVGFHGYSAADQFWLIVDDVTVYDASDPVWEWQGGTDTDWFKNANWEGGIVPGELDQVKIPAAPTNQPTVGSSSEASYGRVFDLTVDPGATLTLAATHNLRVNGTLTNNGTMQQTLNVPLATPTMFLNVKNVAGSVDKYFGAQINATVAALGNTTVKVRGNQQCPLATSGMLYRCHEIAPTTPNLAHIRFYFTEPEFTPTGHPLPALQVFNYHSGGWNLQARGTDSGTCTTGAVGCFVEALNVSAYSPFGLTAAGPNAVRLASASAEATPVGWLALMAGLAAVAVAALAAARRRRPAA